MSYNGQMSFGLNGDYEAVADLESLAGDLRDARDALVRAARSAQPQSTASSNPGEARRASRRGHLRVIEAE